MIDVSFKTASAGDPAEYILTLAADAQPRAGDLIFAVGRQKTRILDRTERGVDVDGKPFEPYSKKGPYYYYPNGRVGNSKFTVKQNHAAVERHLRTYLDVQEFRMLHTNYEGVGGEQTRSPLFVRRSRMAKGLGVSLDEWLKLTGKSMSASERRGVGIRFESYADFKESMGRGARVDLTGPRAPHMLQAIEVVSDGPLEARLTIHGDEAGRASGHNTGINPRWKSRHQRMFFGVSNQDMADITADLAARRAARMKVKT